MNKKIVTEEFEDSDNSGESESVTPITSSQTTVQPVNTEHVGEAGQRKRQKRQEQVLEHDKPASCCPKQAVRKVRKTVSENITEKESGEKKGQEQVLEENDDAPEVNMSNELVREIKRLIELYSLEEVKKALAVAESDI